jgi:hypothetical protein
MTWVGAMIVLGCGPTASAKSGSRKAVDCDAQPNSRCRSPSIGVGWRCQSRGFECNRSGLRCMRLLTPSKVFGVTSSMAGVVQSARHVPRANAHDQRGSSAGAIS